MAHHSLLFDVFFVSWLWFTVIEDLVACINDIKHCLGIEENIYCDRFYGEVGQEQQNRKKLAELLSPSVQISDALFLSPLN